jgi:hypothetical protein
LVGHRTGRSSNGIKAHFGCHGHGTAAALHPKPARKLGNPGGGGIYTRDRDRQGDHRPYLAGRRRGRWGGRRGALPGRADHGLRACRPPALAVLVHSQDSVRASPARAGRVAPIVRSRYGCPPRAPTGRRRRGRGGRRSRAWREGAGRSGGRRSSGNRRRAPRNRAGLRTAARAGEPRAYNGTDAPRTPATIGAFAI